MVRDGREHELFEALSGAAEPLPDDTRSRIRARIMAGVRPDSARGAFAFASHRLAVAATVLAMLGGGVAYAAERSLPGDPLYALKRSAEDALVAILPPGQWENGLLIRIAARRAEETARLANEGATDEALDNAIDELRSAVQQATPADGTLHADDAYTIRESGAEAPDETREAIDDAISAPGSGGSGTGGDATGGAGSEGTNMTPQIEPDAGPGGKLEPEGQNESSAPDAPTGDSPGGADTSSPKPSTETSGGAGGR